ncbi:class I SAM-dependent methyltransferase [Saccharopolyspora sp. 5N708]|uniref:class I SAM-dependent methyltransferase n=1 Tax=Saccharopolyspora sp. 5N708 TaxID=3457424 RepID=UPI003FD577E7
MEGFLNRREPFVLGSRLPVNCCGRDLIDGDANQRVLLLLQASDTSLLRFPQLAEEPASSNLAREFDHWVPIGRELGKAGTMSVSDPTSTSRRWIGAEERIAGMAWYEDDELWSAFSSVMFSPERAGLAAEVVARSPLFGFPPGARVLDQCCGIGMFAVPLARRGYAVTGVDLSAIMLARAEEAAADAGVRIRLVRSDVLQYVQPGSFDVVLNLFTSFGYFDDPEQNLQVLRNAHASLAPGGQLVVDVLGKEVYAGWVGPPKVVDLDNGMVVMRDTILDGWTRFRTDWTLVHGDTAKHASITCFVYSAAELVALFEAAGFNDVECFGGFGAEPYDNHAKRLIVRGIRVD